MPPGNESGLILLGLGQPGALHVYDDLGHCETLDLPADHALAGRPLPAAERSHSAGASDGTGSKVRLPLGRA
jgi:hypothetical protein